MKILKKALIGIGIALFWIAVWYLVALAVDKEIILPYPDTVAKKLFELAKTSEFLINCINSIFRIMLGLVLGTVFGVMTAILTSRSYGASKLFSPIISIIRTAPVVSFILMAFFWIDVETIPVFIAFLMVLPIMWNSVKLGISSVSKDLSEMCRVMNFSVFKKLKYLYFPSVFPSFVSGFNTSLGLAWKAGISAEVICSTIKSSIGGAMQDAKIYLETDALFAWTVTVILISLFFEKTFKLLTKKSLARFTADKDKEADNED